MAWVELWTQLKHRMWPLGDSKSVAVGVACAGSVEVNVTVTVAVRKIVMVVAFTSIVVVESTVRVQVPAPAIGNILSDDDVDFDGVLVTVVFGNKPVGADKTED